MKNLIPFLFLGFTANAQILADSQTFEVSQYCSGCNVTNPEYSADVSMQTFSAVHIGTSLSGESVAQRLKFSIAGEAGEMAGVVIQSPDAQVLSQAFLQGLSITTYSNSISNADTKTAGSYYIQPMPGYSGRYLVEFPTAAAFDEIEVKLVSTNASSLNDLNVYFAYHIDAALSVKLLNFYGAVDNNMVKLYWSTAVEVNNNYFSVEQSADGINFTEIAKVASQGNTGERKDYFYTVQNPLNGLQYYRLKQTDLDGTNTWYYSVSVDYSVPRDIQPALYPNPNEGEFSYNYSLQDNEQGELAICGVTGRKFAAYSLDPMQQKIVIQNSHLDKGVYNAMFLVDGQVKSSIKLVIR